MDNVDLVLEMGPTQFQITCQVMDLSSVYNLLFGRSWIHASSSVPSFLHQILRFVVNNQLIIVFVKDDCTMIGNSGSKGESSRKTLVYLHYIADIVLVGWISKEKLLMKLNLSETSVMIAKEMIQERYEIGKGSG